MGDNRTRASIAPEDREALRRLCEVGKLIRRTCGNYGTRQRILITNLVAARLRARDLAVSGFNRELVPTEKGIRLNAEVAHVD